MKLRKYLTGVAAALLLTGTSVASAALTPIDVTWNPSATTISTAGPFTFDNIVLNTFANIDITGGTFSEQGFMRLSSFTNDALPVAIPTAGFPGGTPYSLYISFNATGVQSPGVPSTGNFTSLSYTLLGAPGVTTFTADGSGIFSATGAVPITLATGSLLSPGTTSLTVDPVSGLLLPSAQVTASFIPNTTFAGFFVNPAANIALDVTAAFTNTGTVITQFPLANGVRLSLDGGGGNATLAIAAVPEPETYGMLLAGLGLMGFVAQRRKAKPTQIA